MSSESAPIAKVEPTIVKLRAATEPMPTETPQPPPPPPPSPPTQAPAETVQRTRRAQRLTAAEAAEARQHKRENHRLIERRRRETINNGISELSRVLPSQPKNRGTIILKAVEYIEELKQNVAQAKRETEATKRENLLLLEELAVKNKKINDLLLLL